MSLIRSAARTLLATAFIHEGLGAIRHPDPAADVAAGPLDAKAVVQVTGATQVVAGLGLATNTMRRASATALAATLVPATAAAERPWAIEDPDARRAQTRMLLRNVALFGGLVITAMDTEGEPGPVYRAHMAAERARMIAEHTRETTQLRGELAAAGVRARAAQTVAKTAQTRGKIEGTISQARRDAGLAARASKRLTSVAAATGRTTGAVAGGAARGTAKVLKGVGSMAGSVATLAFKR